MPEVRVLSGAPSGYGCSIPGGIGIVEKARVKSFIDNSGRNKIKYVGEETAVEEENLE